MGARRIAYPPRLDLAVRARTQLMPRQKLRPYVMVSRKRKTSITSRDALTEVNSATYGRQTAYILDGGAGVAAFTQQSVGGSGTGGGPGGGGAGGPGGSGGGGWPV